MLEIIGIGALNMDKLYLIERIAEPGEEVRVDEVSEQPGGSAANTIRRSCQTWCGDRLHRKGRR